MMKVKATLKERRTVSVCPTDVIKALIEMCVPDARWVEYDLQKRQWVCEEDKRGHGSYSEVKVRDMTPEEFELLTAFRVINEKLRAIQQAAATAEEG